MVAEVDIIIGWQRLGNLVVCGCTVLNGIYQQSPLPRLHWAGGRNVASGKRHFPGKLCTDELDCCFWISIPAVTKLGVPPACFVVP